VISTKPGSVLHTNFNRVVVEICLRPKLPKCVIYINLPRRENVWRFLQNVTRVHGGIYLLGGGSWRPFSHKLKTGAHFYRALLCIAQNILSQLRH